MSHGSGHSSGKGSGLQSVGPKPGKKIKGPTPTSSTPIKRPKGAPHAPKTPIKAVKPPKPPKAPKPKKK